MTKVISFANQKGGVGKSTLCIQMAFFLVERKHRVLVVDMDGQGNTSSRLARKPGEEEAQYYGTKTSQLFDKNLKNIEVINCPSGVDLIHTPKNDPDLFEMEAVPLDQAVNPKHNLLPLFDNYDFVLVDCPPSLGRKLVAALAMSTHVVCPVQLSGFAVDGVEGLLNTIISVKHSLNPAINILGIIINNMNSRSLTHKKAYTQLVQEVPDLVFRNLIGSRAPLDNATNLGIPVWKIRSGSANAAAREVKAVLNEILERAG
ncbi:MAG: ParA family protein [Thiolinea sp.]